MAATAHSKPPVAEMPSLESGDRLTRDEFERISACRPDIKKAELIEGVVYVASPVSSDWHGEPHHDLGGWLFTYKLGHPGIRSSDNGTLVIDADNEVQPDLMLWHEGRQAHSDERGYVHGAPELAIEIASSFAAIDLNQKLRVYERSGVQEYIVWVVRESAFHWFRLRAGQFVELAADARGMIASEVFPGLRMDVPALNAGDWAAIIAAIEPLAG